MTSGSISSTIFSRFHFIFFFISSWPQVILQFSFSAERTNTMNRSTGNLGKMETDTSGMPLANSMPSLRILLIISPSTRESHIQKHQFSLICCPLRILKYFGRPILHRYANEDVSLGSWLLGLEVEHVDERSMCCGTPPGTQINHTTILTVLIFSSSQSANSFSITYLKIN